MKKIFLLLCLVLPACASVFLKVQAPEIDVVDVRLERVTLFEQTFKVTLRIQNPNNISIPLAGFNYTLYVNDKKLALGSSADAVTLPAKQSVLVSTIVTSSLLGLIRQFQELGETVDGEVGYKVLGEVELQHGGRRLQFERSGYLPLPFLKNAEIKL